MGKNYIIFGGLPGECDFREVVKKLDQQTQESSIKWEWVYCDISTHYEPPKKPFNRAIASLQQHLGAIKKVRPSMAMLWPSA